MNLNFEVVIFPRIRAHKQAQHNERLVERQMINELSRPEQICGQTKVGKCKCEHFTKFCSGLHEIFGLPVFYLSSFVVCFNVVEFIWFDKIFKYVI